MKRLIVLSLFWVIVSGCGSSLAPLDATVVGPDDSTASVEPPGGGTLIYKALDFQVTNSAGLGLPDVEIELLASSFNGAGILTDLDGNPLNPNNPPYFKTKTDDRGLVRTSFVIALPNCDPNGDITVTGGVNATVGVSGKLWTTTITVKQCA